MHAAKHTEEECPEEEVPCGLCKDRMLRRLLQGHMVDPMVQAKHMNVMASKVAELTSMCAELRTENATLKRKVRGGALAGGGGGARLTWLLTLRLLTHPTPTLAVLTTWLFLCV
jgi:hypothetical protein